MRREPLAADDDCPLRTYISPPCDVLLRPARIFTSPPSAPAPADTTTSPPAVDADPAAIEIAPEPAPTELPVDNDRDPDCRSAAADATVTALELPSAAVPAARDKLPPLLPTTASNALTRVMCEAPATANAPLIPLLLVPMEMATSPLLAPSPVWIFRLPDEVDAVPVLIATAPLDSSVPTDDSTTSAAADNSSMSSLRN